MAEHVVGTVDDFPVGSHKVVSVGRASIGVFNVDGELYAMPNICPHQFGPVCEGHVTATMLSDSDHDWQHYWGLHGRVISCPWHGIEFDVTTGEALANPKLKVRKYPVSVIENEVRITL
jgi:nitrite reductase/ring-hydroxylating ferredoxin subunit